MSRVQTFNGIHVSQVVKLQLRILNFGLPSSYSTDENVGKIPYIIGKDRQCMSSNVCNIVDVTYNMC
jgi:hypothetical protein